MPGEPGPVGPPGVIGKDLTVYSEINSNRCPTVVVKCRYECRRARLSQLPTELSKSHENGRVWVRSSM